MLQAPEASAMLIKMLQDQKQHPMVRHEAAEALGAIGTETCYAALTAHKEDACQEVRETCQLALRRIEDLAKGTAFSSTAIDT
jgi:deoxyhypusine monooxygenase